MKVYLGSENYVPIVSYFSLFTTSIFVNKYVLSVLNFTYPTVFQGWQTLIGGILLKVLLCYKFLEVSITSLDKSGFISLLPTFLFFTAGVVASSKALSILNVPVFLCLHNTVSSFLYIVQLISSFKENIKFFPLISSLVNLSSAAAIVFYSIEESFSDSPYIWMLVYVSSLIVQNIHATICDQRFNEIDRLYYCYIFSVVILTPSSLYLEEAFVVLKFPHVARVDFYGGCLLSGITGLFLNLFFFKVRILPRFGLIDSFSRLVMSSLSLLLFVNTSSLLVNSLICINFMSSVLIPVYNVNYLESSKEKEAFQPLISEDL